MSDSGPLASGSHHLERHFGLLTSVALNVTMLVGSGVFLTIPLMIGKLPGPYALVGWLAAGVLMLVDGLVWSELGAALPGSGGSYRYLLESYGRHSWGRMMAFLFIWQFLISGPLEIAAGFVSIAQVSNSLDPDYATFNKAWTTRFVLGGWQGKDIAVSIGPSQVGCVLLGVVILSLLYRRVTGLGKLTVTFWLGVLGAIGWILVEGWSRFDPGVAFDFPWALDAPVQWGPGLGAAMVFAMYSYLGYYHVCYIGDEVRDPARTIPRSILLTAVLVCLLFLGLHLALVGTISWREVPADLENLPAELMARIHGPWAAKLVTLCIIWSSFGSIFASLLGYSRIPYGAARYGHFFAVFARVHPVRRLPHVSLFLVAGLTFFWSFFDLGDVIDALVTTRILGLFLAQIFAVMLLRRSNAQLPFRMWLYPLPCALALAGWGYMYVTSRLPFIVFSLAVLTLGTVAFLAWARWTGGWPFGSRLAALEIPSPSPLDDSPGRGALCPTAAAEGNGPNDMGNTKTNEQAKRHGGAFPL